MMNITSILKEYCNGDFEKRLSLFLDYRDIRNEFIRIDESDFTMKHIDKGLKGESSGTAKFHR